ncbi:hypothetical protein F511_27268 [Dorcoceras hygrometricum]|uniref:Uncharacterized protein n=1 Tax=Dorcoceras hygrometricum TaxID=472368 RepID=A0A2Z7B617_9LAMI|nr:hypothetical protein F511_27268 [Dorcoceras hygrometricum]
MYRILEISGGSDLCLVCIFGSEIAFGTILEVFAFFFAEEDVNAGQHPCSARRKRRRLDVATGCPAARDLCVTVACSWYCARASDWMTTILEIFVISSLEVSAGSRFGDHIEEVKAENIDLKNSSVEPSTVQLGEADSLKIELSKLKDENELLRSKYCELESEILKSKR